MTTLGSAPVSGSGMEGGRRKSGASVKTLKKVLKKAGLKTSGRKAALTRRAKKAHLMRGGEVKPAEEVAEVVEEKVVEESPAAAMGGRRRSRKSRGGNYKLY